MSDDKRKKKDLEKDEILEDKSTPTILDEGFVKWAERCFNDDEQANTFVVTQLLGRTGKAEGSCLRSRPVGHLKVAGGVKREALIAICNELIEEMQDEANQMRQPRRFVVVAHSSVKGNEFARKTIECIPKSSIVKLGDRPLTGEGEDGEVDLLGGDLLRKRSETVLQDGRFYAELVAQVMGGQLQLTLEQNREKDRMIKELFDANMALARQANEAENNKLDRDLIRAEREVALSFKRKGISLLAGILPDFLKKVTNGTVNVPSGQTAESLALDAIMDEKDGGLTGEQKYKIFGNWTDAGECLTPGILTEKQVRIIVGVWREGAPVTEIDRLITDGSPEQLTMDQYGKIMGILKEDADKLLPLVNILQSHKEALSKAASQPKTET